MEIVKNAKTKASIQRKQELERELDRILPIIIEKYQPEKIILFGSLSTGEVHEWSDLDLAVIKETSLNYFDRLFELKKMLHSKLATDLFIYRPDEFARRRAENHYFVTDEIIGKGRTIYERRSRLA